MRALIGVAGIAFGVAAMLAILAIVTGAIGMFQRILSNDSHVLVFERNVSDLFFSSVTTEQVAVIRERPDVVEAHPLLFGIVSAPGHPVVTCFGVEADDPRLKQGEWESGSRADFVAGEGRVFLGHRAAGFMKASQGDEIEIGRGTFHVAGILKNENGFEDGGVFLPLADAQSFFHREGAVSVVAVKLKDRNATDVFKTSIEKAESGLTALENREFSRSYNSFKILNLTAWAVGICAFFLGGLGVANTMLLSVFSRIREIAVLRVCGFSQGQVAALILGEAAAIAAVGLVVGFAIGLTLLAGLEQVPQFNGYVQASLQVPVMFGIVATALITAMAGAIYPARFAARIQPAEALRYE